MEPAPSANALQPVIRIGRGDDNEIVLPDSSAASRALLHAQLANHSTGDCDPATNLQIGQWNLRQRADRGRLPAEARAGRRCAHRLLPAHLSRHQHRAPSPGKAPTLPAFEIETAAVDLNELQDREASTLLEPSGNGDAGSLPPQLRALELLHEVGVR